MPYITHEVWKVTGHQASSVFSGDKAGADKAAAALQGTADRMHARYVVLPLGGSPFDAIEDQAADDPRRRTGPITADEISELEFEAGFTQDADERNSGATISQIHARQLAAQMTDWLTGHVGDRTPLDHASPELVEWCRAARDHLAQS